MLTALSFVRKVVFVNLVTLGNVIIVVYQKTSVLSTLWNVQIRNSTRSVAHIVVSRVKISEIQSNVQNGNVKRAAFVTMGYSETLKAIVLIKLNVI